MEARRRATRRTGAMGAGAGLGERSEDRFSVGQRTGGDGRVEAVISECVQAAAVFDPGHRLLRVAGHHQQDQATLAHLSARWRCARLRGAVGELAGSGRERVGVVCDHHHASERQLGRDPRPDAGQAPDRIMRSMPLQFEMVNQRASGTQNFLVLLGRNPTEVTAADVTRAFPDDLRLVLQSVPRHQRLVHGHVSAFGVFDEKRHVRRSVEKPFQPRDLHLRNVRRQGRFGMSCARIHGSMRFGAESLVANEGKNEWVNLSYSMRMPMRSTA